MRKIYQLLVEVVCVEQGIVELERALAKVHCQLIHIHLPADTQIQMFLHLENAAGSAYVAERVTLPSHVQILSLEGVPRGSPESKSRPSGKSICSLV